MTVVDLVGWTASRPAPTMQAMNLRRFGHFGKTGTFAVIHLAIAVALGYVLTGSFVLAGLIAVIEPTLNTAAHAVFDRWWARRHGEEPSLAKTGVFAGIHFTNAVLVVWLLTGSLAVAGAVAVIEPLANAVALYFFDRWWAGAGHTRNTLRPVPA